MVHDVPFSSQYADLGRHEWRARGCGIASLKMVMDFWHRKDRSCRAPSLDDLLNTGLEIGAYREGVGWIHRGLVEIAKRYGYDGYNGDFAEKGSTPKSATDAWRAVVSELERGPVMVSVYSRFDPASRDGHLIAVSGWDGQLVSFNDPEQIQEREGRRALALKPFLVAFKRRIIVIRPRERITTEHPGLLAGFRQIGIV